MSASVRGRQSSASSAKPAITSSAIAACRPHLGGDQAERIEGRIAGRLACEGQRGQRAGSAPAVRCAIGLIAQFTAHVLLVGNIVAPAAPGIEQPHPLARLLVEQARWRRQSSCEPARSTGRACSTSCGAVAASAARGVRLTAPRPSSRRSAGAADTRPSWRADSSSSRRRDQDVLVRGPDEADLGHLALKASR